MTAPYYEGDGVTLYLGDCLEITEWLAADVLVTDPPYGYAVDHRAVRQQPIAGNEDTGARDRALSMWGDRRPACMFGQWKATRPDRTAQVLIWDKTDGLGPGRGDLANAFGVSHEEVYLIGEWRKTGKRQGSVIRTTQGIQWLTETSGHPTPKPLALMERLVGAAPPGVIADPFAGSGSTLVAARNLGRQAIGVEIEERYCEIIARRLDQAVLPL